MGRHCDCVNTLGDGALHRTSLRLGRNGYQLKRCQRIGHITSCCMERTSGAAREQGSGIPIPTRTSPQVLKHFCLKLRKFKKLLGRLTLSHGCSNFSLLLEKSGGDNIHVWQIIMNIEKKRTRISGTSARIAPSGLSRIIYRTTLLPDLPRFVMNVFRRIRPGSTSNCSARAVAMRDC